MYKITQGINNQQHTHISVILRITKYNHCFICSISAGKSVCLHKKIPTSPHNGQIHCIIFIIIITYGFGGDPNLDKIG